MGGLPAFDRYIGIDYSGAETPVSSLKGLRIYMADRNGASYRGAAAAQPTQITAFRFRCGISTSTTCRTIGLHFSTISSGIGRQMTNTPTLISCAMAFMAMVQPDAVTRGGGASQKKEPERSLCFHFDVPGSVAKSTHAGLPWLRYIRLHVAQRALLAFRWLGCTGGTVSRRRSLSIALEARLCAGES